MLGIAKLLIQYDKFNIKIMIFSSILVHDDLSEHSDLVFN